MNANTYQQATISQATKQFLGAAIDLTEASILLGAAIYNTATSDKAKESYKAVWTVTKASFSLTGQIAHLVALHALLGLLALLDWLDDSQQEIRSAYQAAQEALKQAPSKAWQTYQASKGSWSGVYSRLAQEVPSRIATIKQAPQSIYEFTRGYFERLD